MIELPCFIINFKTYEKGTGSKAFGIIKEIERVARRTGKNIYVCPQYTDIRTLRKRTNEVKILAQHVDPISYGSHTGHVLPEAVKEAGAIGTLLNHSERKMKYEEIKQATERARGVGLDVIVDVEKPSEIRRIEKLEPDCIGIEPPELIGGNVSVSTARPEIIEESVKKTDIPVICGAGIKTQKDVEKALELGAKGILIASGVIKSSDPYKTTKELVRPL